jgi:hypothetical protein
MKQDNTEMNDARQQQRADLLKSANIERADGKPPVGCQISNISAEGAELKLGAGQRAPDQFTLYVPHEGMAYRATVRWRAEGRIGVEFHGAEQREKGGLRVVAG